MTAPHPDSPAAGADDGQPTFGGSDPDKVAASALCASTPTKCQARTRLYRHGVLEHEGFPVEEISEYLRDESAVIWLDLRDPDRADLEVLSAEFGLHPVAVEDAVHDHERPKLDRYNGYLFLAAYAVNLDADTGELDTSELAAFITKRALITVRKDDGLDIGAVLSYWDASPDLAKCGVGYLLHGVVLPMREVVNALMRRDLHLLNDPMQPYYQDVYDHVLRATEWTESLRDLVTTILETNLTIQGNRMNIITKKVTSWAAIIAVPTFVTGFYGMNVPYAGFGKPWGVAAAVIFMAVASVTLYLVFKAKDWL